MFTALQNNEEDVQTNKNDWQTGQLPVCLLKTFLTDFNQGKFSWPVHRQLLKLIRLQEINKARPSEDWKEEV